MDFLMCCRSLVRVGANEHIGETSSCQLLIQYRRDPPSSLFPLGSSHSPQLGPEPPRILFFNSQEIIPLPKELRMDLSKMSSFFLV
jgi:hypothetical protein